MHIYAYLHSWDVCKSVAIGFLAKNQSYNMCHTWGLIHEICLNVQKCAKNVQKISSKNPRPPGNPLSDGQGKKFFWRFLLEMGKNSDWNVGINRNHPFSALKSTFFQKLHIYAHLCTFMHIFFLHIFIAWSVPVPGVSLFSKNIWFWVVLWPFQKVLSWATFVVKGKYSVQNCVSTFNSPVAGTSVDIEIMVGALKTVGI